MEYKKLYLTIISTLAVGVLVSIALDQVLFWGTGFFLNLSTELLGLLIGFILIEMLIRRNDRNEWKKVEDSVLGQTAQILNTSYMYLRALFEIPIAEEVEYFQQGKPGKWSEMKDAAFIVAMLRERVLPKVEESLLKFSLDDWEEVGIITATALEQTEKLFTMFGSKLSSDVYEKLIALQAAGYRLSGFAEIVFKKLLHPNPHDSYRPIAQYVNALADLGTTLENKD